MALGGISIMPSTIFPWGGERRLRYFVCGERLLCEEADVEGVGERETEGKKYRTRVP